MKAGSGDVENEPTVNIDEVNSDLEYLVYSNDRYGFSIEYPDIFTDYWEADSGDGISLENSDLGIQLLVYGANNTAGQTSKEIYEANLRDKSKVLYKFQKDNWHVISWEDGDEEFYEKMVVGEGSLNTFGISYPKQHDQAYNDIVEHLFKTFRTPAIDIGH